MTPLAQAISRSLIHFVWEGSIAGLLLWAVLFALRKRSANLRYIASCAALGAMALMPIVTVWVLYSRQNSAGMAAAAAAAPHFSQPFFATASTRFPFQQSAWLAWLQAWALPAWSLGVLLFSVRFLFGYRHAFMLGRCGRLAGASIVEVVARLTRCMRVDRPVRVLISSIVETPSVVGWLRPVILLPAATLMGLTPLQLEAILAHEIGHIKRYDYLVNMLQMLVETLLFYQPAVWWTSKRIRLERELCCDDLAVRFSGNALRYARALTTLEKLRLRTPGMAMASTGGPLLYRIQRLAGVTAKEYGPSRLPALLAISLGALCFTLNVTWVRGQDAQGVKVDLGSSSVIHRTPVPYPEAALKRGLTGTVQVEVKLDSTGNVFDAHVLTGPEELRKTALESVLNWHFTSDAARGTRLVTIAFSEQGKHVQVREPHIYVYKGKQVMVDESGRKIEQQKMELMQAQHDLVLAWKVRAKEAQPEVRAELELKLKQLRKEFETMPLPAGNAGLGVMAGRAVKAINTGDLSDSVRGDLLSRLPIREGDALSADSIKQTAMAVRDFDEHLRVQFLVTDGPQVEIRIVGPNERR